MTNLYTVESNREILGLGGIYGPLSEPTAIPYNDVLQMVRLGYKIYQVNPKDPTEKVKVTIKNINTIRFSNSRAMAVNKRKLNREIQEMGKPIMADVVRNNTAKKAEPPKKEETPITTLVGNDFTN